MTVVPRRLIIRINSCTLLAPSWLCPFPLPFEEESIDYSQDLVHVYSPEGRTENDKEDSNCDKNVFL